MYNLYIVEKTVYIEHHLNMEFKTVFVSPDRSRDERAAHQQLVLRLKEKVKTDPENYHFIRNGTLMSKPKN